MYRIDLDNAGFISKTVLSLYSREAVKQTSACLSIHSDK